MGRPARVPREGVYVRADGSPVLAPGEDLELAAARGEKAVDGDGVVPVRGYPGAVGEGEAGPGRPSGGLSLRRRRVQIPCGPEDNSGPGAYGSGRVSSGSKRSYRLQVSGKSSGTVLANTSLQVGVALGIAILLTVAAARTEVLTEGGAGTVAALTAGFKYSFAAGASVVISGALVVFLVLKPQMRKP